MSPVLKNVAAKIIQLRKAQNLTQEQLSEKSNISLDELQKIENADSSFHMNELFKLSEILKFNLSKLFFDCEKQHKTKLNNIKKLLQNASDESLNEIESYIKSKLKIK